MHTGNTTCYHHVTRIQRVNFTICSYIYITIKLSIIYLLLKTELHYIVLYTVKWLRTNEVFSLYKSDAASIQITTWPLKTGDCYDTHFYGTLNIHIFNHTQASNRNCIYWIQEKFALSKSMILNCIINGKCICGSVIIISLKYWLYQKVFYMINIHSKSFNDSKTTRQELFHCS